MPSVTDGTHVCCRTPCPCRSGGNSFVRDLCLAVTNSGRWRSFCRSVPQRYAEVPLSSWHVPESEEKSASYTLAKDAGDDIVSEQS